MAKTKLDALQNSVWRLFITANVKLLNCIGDKFSQAGLPTMDWYDVLLTLKEAPEHRLRLSDLAEKTLLSRSNLTHLLDRLEKAELLYRKRCPNDRRGTYAVLTEAGLEMQQKMWAVYAAGIAEYFGNQLDEEDLKVMQRALERMIAATCE
ncbi:MarR family winged helix-turn-helix transcriptional regulator [Altericista sp. CCNU0014]|uniref:MarR family winged helix-turn-helix transcriptional regulator n=1 Tax=Altericista sp. CCNU0014 TaxID=3082949 RepID=UPI00384B955F